MKTKTLLQEPEKFVSLENDKCDKWGRANGGQMAGKWANGDGGIKI
jgi:hypothetical protein